MAIDDNTVYGLTGAQIKELPGKIKAVEGMAKGLTASDFNYDYGNTGSNNCIALWLLPAGMYVRTANQATVPIRFGSDSSGEASDPFKTFIVMDTNNNTTPKQILSQMENSVRSDGSIYYYYTSFLSSTGQRVNAEIFLYGSSVVDSLNSTLSNKVLSARQGKVLKDLIDTLDASLATVAKSGSYNDLTDKPNISGDISTAVATETSARQAADTNLQGQIDAIVAGSDVKDIVGTKADLNNYDTTTLGNNDIIKVLADETQSNATTYYRWSTSTSTFSLIGSEGPYYTKSATDTLLNAKADASTTYTKTEVDTALSAKADTSTTYTKTQVDTALSAKADASTTYTKTEVDTALTAKADASTTYTKTEVDTALGAKANSADVYTKAQTDSAISTAVSGAEDVVYIPMTITSVQDMTFSTTETSTAIAAMMDAGKKVMYRMSIPVSVAGLAPGVYDFTAQYHWTGDNDAIIIDAVMSGVLGFKCMGIAHHSGNVGQIEIYYLQERLTNDNKLSTSYVDTSGSTGYKFVLVTENDPDSSTVGSVGDVRVCRLNSHAFVCTAVDNGVYTWSQLRRDIPAATHSSPGLMTASDKTKLDNLGSVVTKLNTPITTTTTVSVPYNVRNTATGTDTSTSISLPAATTSKAGVLTSADKTKINNMPVITMTTTDPGEGSALAANNFIAVYS